MKRGPQQRERKNLSAAGLLKLVKKSFSFIQPEKLNKLGKTKKIKIVDSLMSALAMFSLKSPLLLAFDQGRNDPFVSNNLKNLFGIQQAPSDTHMREELDKINPAQLRESFLFIFTEAQRGKLLEEYRFLDGILLLIDGTGFFNSENISCDDCCKKNHKDGKVTYYHQALVAVIAHPSKRQVIPLCPELISKQDGAEKNDCERRALQRFLADLKKEHPRLKITLAYDALAANTPTINDIKSYGHHFIIAAKPDGNKALFEWIKGLELQEKSIVVGKNNYAFRYINKIPLNDTKDAPEVNFLECIATEFNGKRVTRKIFTWVTDHTITDDNVYLIMEGGRTRWKIENETFNTLKNQGYQFEHNFGHGNKHLYAVFILLMMLAFLIDQIQEVACGLFQAALATTISRRALWDKMRCYFQICFIDSWESLFVAISQSIGATLSSQTP